MESKQIISLISRIRERANKFIIQEMANHDIKGLVPSHGDILVSLFNHKELTMKELANFIEKDKSTVTALVDKLLAMGYVSKRKDQSDSRVSFISLTKKGQELKPDFEEISNKLLSEVFKGISGEEKEVVINVLIKIKDNL